MRKKTPYFAGQEIPDPLIARQVETDMLLRNRTAYTLRYLDRSTSAVDNHRPRRETVAAVFPVAVGMALDSHCHCVCFV